MITFYWPWMFLLLPLPLLIRLWFKPVNSPPSANTSLALKIPAFNDILSLYANERFESTSKKTLIILSLIWILLVVTVAQQIGRAHV